MFTICLKIVNSLKQWDYSKSAMMAEGNSVKAV